jgi:hypothetical protein
VTECVLASSLHERTLWLIERCDVEQSYRDEDGGILVSMRRILPSRSRDADRKRRGSRNFRTRTCNNHRKRNDPQERSTGTEEEASNTLNIGAKSSICKGATFHEQTVYSA